MKRGRRPKYNHVIQLKLNAKELWKRVRESVNSGGDCSTNSKPEMTPLIFSNPTDDPLITKIQSKPRHTNTLMGKTTLITMIDYVNFGCLPNCTDIKCWHDHHSFTTPPIGIPIKYIPKTCQVRPEENELVVEGQNDYFLTKGIVCSFSCALGYIKSHQNDPDLVESMSLLHAMYIKLYGEELKVKPAPDPYSLMYCYGGSISIEDYRKNYCGCKYIITPNIKRPYMVAVGKYVNVIKSLK